MMKTTSAIVALLAAAAANTNAASVSNEKSLENVLSREMFDQMFSHRVRDANCAKGIEQLTYENLVAAHDKFFPNAFTSGSDEENKRELAAFLGQVSQETTGHWGAEEYAWGMCFTEERDCKGIVCENYTDYGSADYVPVAGKSYHGRGALQVTWNTNYGQVSEYLFGDKDVLLKNPEYILESGENMFHTSLWFWMTPQGSKPSAHNVMLNRVPSESCRPNGYGTVTNIINGGLECGVEGIPHHAAGGKVYGRISYYKRYCEMLGVDHGEYTECQGQINYESECPAEYVTPKDGVAPGPANKHSRCGVNYEDANAKCGTLCPSNVDSECPGGESCFGELDTAICGIEDTSTTSTEAPAPTSTSNIHSRCGLDWDDAAAKCGTLCPSNVDSECPGGERCFGEMDTAICGIEETSTTSTEAPTSTSTSTSSVAPTSTSTSSAAPTVPCVTETSTVTESVTGTAFETTTVTVVVDGETETPVPTSTSCVTATSTVTVDVTETAFETATATVTVVV